MNMTAYATDECVLGQSKGRHYNASRNRATQYVFARHRCKTTCVDFHQKISREKSVWLPWWGAWASDTTPRIRELLTVRETGFHNH
jgi:hypothetical protein